MKYLIKKFIFKPSIFIGFYQIYLLFNSEMIITHITNQYLLHKKLTAYKAKRNKARRKWIALAEGTTCSCP